MRQVDVLVCGAGPAGSAAAIAAARSGARVLLAERAEFPRHKACGCCLSEQGTAVLRELGAAHSVHDGVPLRAVRVLADGRALEVTREAGVAIGRDVLDTRLARIAADMGAEVVFGAAARADADGTWHVGTERVAAGCAVVADGLSGRSIDALPGYGWQVRTGSRMGFGAVLPAGSVDCPRGEIRMHVTHDGYVGLVELPDGSVDVAAAAAPAAVRSAGGPAEYARRALGADVIDPARLASADWRGAPPLTRRRARVAGPGVLVAGDAAGYVEPFTGEGMGWAIASGAAAGGLAADVARGRAACDRWPRMHASIVRGSRLRCAAIALAVRSPRTVRAAIAVGRLAPGLARRIASTVGSARR